MIRPLKTERGRPAGAAGGTHRTARSARAMGTALTLTLFLILTACAAPQGRFTLAVDSTLGPLVWPPPDSGQVPRFRLLGQLIGEENYRRTGAAGARGVRGALAWLVGLEAGRDELPGLRRPSAVIVDERGRVLVADVALQQVVVFDPTAGEPEFWPVRSAGRPLSWPAALVEGPDGEIWVADAGAGEVVRLSSQGQLVGRVGAGELDRPAGLAWDAAAGRMFVADAGAHRIRIFSGDGRALDGAGDPVGTGLNAPTHLAWANGRLYISDTLNARIVVIDPDSGARSTIGRRGLRLGELVRPKGVAVGGDSLYVVEGMHDHLLVYDLVGRFRMAVGGTGKGGGQFYLPSGMAVDRSGRVFVADTFNGRVTVLQPLPEPM